MSYFIFGLFSGLMVDYFWIFVCPNHAAALGTLTKIAIAWGLLTCKLAKAAWDKWEKRKAAAP